MSPRPPQTCCFNLSSLPQPFSPTAPHPRSSTSHLFLKLPATSALPPALNSSEATLTLFLWVHCSPLFTVNEFLGVNPTRPCDPWTLKILMVFTLNHGGPANGRRNLLFAGGPLQAVFSDSPTHSVRSLGSALRLRGAQCLVQYNTASLQKIWLQTQAYAAPGMACLTRLSCIQRSLSRSFLYLHTNSCLTDRRPSWAQHRA